MIEFHRITYFQTGGTRIAKFPLDVCVNMATGLSGRSPDPKPGREGFLFPGCFNVKRRIISRILIIVTLILATAFWAGAAVGEEPHAMVGKVTLDINSNGKKIELRTGDELVIELQVMGGAGYGWYFDGFDSDHFDLIGEETKPVNQEKGIVGAPVLGLWTLRAARPGTGFIRMKYYRVWEGKDSSIRQFEVEVNIQ